MEDVEKVQQTAKSTGIDKNMNVYYANHTPGSVIFTFLIPETMVSCFSDLDEDSQKDLADHGILSIEVNCVVGASLSETHTSVTALQDTCVCRLVCGHIQIERTGMNVIYVHSNEST